MSVFYIGSYDIVDPGEFQKYPPIVLSLLPKYGGVVLASDTAAFVVEGTTRTMNAIIRFPSRQDALGLYNDPAYQEAKRIRQSSTRKIRMVLVDEYRLAHQRSPGTTLFIDGVAIVFLPAVQSCGSSFTIEAS